MGLISRVSSRTYREKRGNLTKTMLFLSLPPRSLVNKLNHIRLLSGSQIVKAGSHVPPGYNNLTLPLDELPARVPDGPMTPQLRAKLAAKYNMRPEDYKPMSWNPNDSKQGDYPDLPDYHGFGGNKHYDWDDVYYRKNFGEARHYNECYNAQWHPGGMVPTTDGVPIDWFRQRNCYALLWICLISFALLNEYLKDEYGLLSVVPNRGGDGFDYPYQMYNIHYHKYMSKEGHTPYRFTGKQKSIEDNTFLRWGYRKTNNYTIDGWEDLEKVPDMAHFDDT